MPIDVQPPRLSTEESPRSIIAADFKSLGGELPIGGGWGYTLEDAVVIDKDDPVVPEGIPFHGISIEVVFVEKRIYEELIVCRPPWDQYSGIQWNKLRQELISHGGRHYDKLIFEVTALPARDWNELKAEWEGPGGYGSSGFDEQGHIAKRDARTVRYVTHYWFDITSFFGK